MPDQKEVIKGLEYCTLQARKGWPYEPEITKSGCEISACPYIGNCGEMLFDALAILKEQEAIEPIEMIDDYHLIGDPLRTIGWKCGKCMERIAYKDNYCSNCGQAMKWND